MPKIPKRKQIKGFYHLDFVDKHLSKEFSEEDLQEMDFSSLIDTQDTSDRVSNCLRYIRAEIWLMVKAGYTKAKMQDYLYQQYAMIKQNAVVLIQSVYDDVYDDVSKSKKDLYVEFIAYMELAMELAVTNKDIRVIIDIAKTKLGQVGDIIEKPTEGTQISLFGDN